MYRLIFTLLGHDFDYDRFLFLEEYQFYTEAQFSEQIYQNEAEISETFLLFLIGKSLYLMGAIVFITTKSLLTFHLQKVQNDWELLFEKQNALSPMVLA